MFEADQMFKKYTRQNLQIEALMVKNTFYALVFVPMRWTFWSKEVNQGYEHKTIELFFTIFLKRDYLKSMIQNVNFIRQNGD